MRRISSNSIYFLIFCLIPTGIYYHNFQPLSSIRTNNEFHYTINKLKSSPLDEHLFPWLDLSFNQLRKTFQNLDGIVICTSNHHIPLTFVTLHSLMILFNRTKINFPIELVFSSHKDLNENYQQAFQRTFPQIILRDLSRIFNTHMLQLQGWQIKPFAILASHFRRVLLLDADVFLLQSPSILLTMFNRFNTSAIFFVDRVNLSTTTQQWIRQEFNLTITTFHNRSQESGIVLIDKTTDAALRGLMTVCKLNEPLLREKYFYRYLYGDKDTFWLGFALVHVDYSFVPSLTAVIGRNNSPYVCGHMLHLDEYNQPLWWNGGFHLNRYFDIFLNVDGWLDEGQWFWTLTQACISNKNRTIDIFSSNQLQLIREYSKLTQDIFSHPTWFSWKKWLGILLT